MFILREGLMFKYVASSFAKKKYFRKLRKRNKNIRGVSCWNPGGLGNGQSLHGLLDRQSYYVYNTQMYIYIYTYIYIYNIPIFNYRYVRYILYVSKIRYYLGALVYVVGP